MSGCYSNFFGDFNAWRYLDKAILLPLRAEISNAQKYLHNYLRDYGFEVMKIVYCPKLTE